MQEHAQVVIIGGGIYGVNIAYHLAKGGWSNIVLVEKQDISSGATPTPPVWSLNSPPRRPS